MLKIFLSITLIALTVNPKPAYHLFNQEGQAVSYDQMTQAMLDADVVLFGELHNNPICHWLQLELTESLYGVKGKDLVLAAEMFETDDQLVLDEYLAGLIKTSHLTSETKVWNNYETDYAPLVEFAKSHELQFVASNIPRRYASVVARKGPKALEALPKAAQALMMPLPLEADLTLPGYSQMLEMMQGGHGGGMQPENFAYAQAAKDATMAHSILKYFEKGKTVLHFNGSFHSNNFDGIYWYLKQQQPELKIVTIASVEQASIQALDSANQQLADFILCIPTNMTKTY